MSRAVCLLLLLLHPPAFRRRYGAEVRQFLRDVGGRPAALRTTAVLGDLLASLAREWWGLFRSAQLTRTLTWRDHMGHLLRDLRYSVRMLLRSPGFALSAIATLALGIGANTAIVSLADATLLRPLDVRDPDSLFVSSSVSSYPEVQEYTGRRDLFADVGAIAGGGPVALAAQGASELASNIYVTGGMFEMLGVQPASGRLLQPGDDTAGDNVAVLGYDHWTRRFGRSPEIVGRLVQVNGRPVTIVGVAPRGFHGLAIFGNPDLYQPLGGMPRIATGRFARGNMLTMRDVRWLTTIVRMREGTSPVAAAAAVDGIRKADVNPRGRARPEAPFEWRPLAVGALGGGADTARRFVLLLAAVVLLTLLIACANLANLLLVRGAARRREIGVRLAIGAQRGQILTQMLVESLVIASLGGAAALGVAKVALGLLRTQELPGGLRGELLQLELDATAVGVTFALSLATGVLFGTFPAWRAARTDAMTVLRDDPRTGSARSLARSGLVAAQVALCIALLAGAGLFMRSLVRALDVPLGFRPDAVVLSGVSPSLARFNAGRAAVFYQTAHDRISRLPGVASAAWSTFVPTAGSMMASMDVFGYERAPQEDVFLQVARVGPRYFETAGTRLLQGREFAPTDTLAGPPVAIVNEAAAARYFQGRAVGGRVKTFGESERWATVVGVAENTKIASLGEEPEPMVYFPFEQGIDGEGAPVDRAYLLVRGDGAAQRVEGLVGEELRQIDRAMPVDTVTRLEARAARFTTPQRMGATLLGLFSALALCLAVLGVYAVSVYMATLRTREIGIRVALGAGRSHITRMILRDGGLPVFVGLVAGTVLALWGSRFMTALLFDTRAWDPLTFAAVNILLSLVALAAIYFPARRAATAPPVDALRA